MGRWVEPFQDLDVYHEACELAMSVFDLSTRFPKDEAYSLTSQIRRSSRSVAANIAEAGETQNWLAFAVRCGYLDRDAANPLNDRYAQSIYSLGSMIIHAESLAKH